METLVPIVRIKKLDLWNKLVWIFLVMRVAASQSIKAYYELGRFYNRMGDLLSAEDCFAKATSRYDLEDPMQRNAMYFQARAKQERGDHDQALALFKLLSWAEKSERVALAQAVSLAKLELWDQVEIAARNAYLLNPLSKNKMAQGLLAQAAFLNGKIHYANIMLEGMLKDPTVDDIVLLQNWVEVLCALEKFDKAKEIAEKAVFLVIERASEVKRDQSSAYALGALAMRIEKSFHNRPLQQLAMDLAKAILPPPMTVIKPMIT